MEERAGEGNFFAKLCLCAQHRMEKDSKRFSKSGGWGYAVFNYEAASDKFSPDAKSLSDCGFACHTPVKAKDYIFHPYQKR